MKSIRAKLVLVTLAAVTAGALIAGLAIFVQYRAFIRNDIDETLSTSCYAASVAADWASVGSLFEPGAEDGEYRWQNLRRLVVIQEHFGLEFVYALVKNEAGQPVFVHDTMAITSPDEESTFLTTYDDAPPELEQAFVTGKLVIAKQYTDQWGTFKSAFLPVVDPSGAVLAVIGADLEISDVQTRYRNAMFTLAGAVIIAVLVMLSFVLPMTGRLARPIRILAAAAEQIASGDLGRTVSVRGRDEIAKLSDAFNRMSGQLRKVISSIAETAQQVASSSEEISSSAQQLSSGAQNQASTLEETSASVEELTASVEQVSATTPRARRHRWRNPRATCSRCSPPWSRSPRP